METTSRAPRPHSKHNKHSFQSLTRSASTSWTVERDSRTKLRINSKLLHHSTTCQDHFTNTSGSPIHYILGHTCTEEKSKEGEH
eukprot:3099153-Amphidinium_carterae.1